MQATVYKSTGSWYIVKTSAGDFCNARIKGKFKIDGISSSNPIAVGDIVELVNEKEEESIMINNIHPRKNYIVRTSPHNKNQHHIIAANIDQTLLFATLKDPKTSLGFIDRFLITAEAYHIPAIIVFNKIDLLNEMQHEELLRLKEVYEKMLEAKLTFTWHEFNGQHAFMRDEGERYDPELALLGYELALKLFQRKLA